MREKLSISDFQKHDFKIVSSTDKRPNFSMNKLLQSTANYRIVVWSKKKPCVASDVNCVMLGLGCRNGCPQQFPFKEKQKSLQDQQIFLLRRVFSYKHIINNDFSCIPKAKPLKNTNARLLAASITAIGDQAESSVRLLPRSNSAAAETLIDDEEHEEVAGRRGTGRERRRRKPH
ncbi:hypothetical protein BDC45DRAFT_529287 [Circinella umbellata]|nr:hypothetical protein BDC45DRAFT_529287 [Circinella umbellata]